MAVRNQDNFKSISTDHISYSKWGEAKIDIKRLNINNKGSDELIVLFSLKHGRSYPSWEENDHGFMILDLDNMVELFSFSDLFHIDNPPYPKPKNYINQNYYYSFDNDTIIFKDSMEEKNIYRKYKYIMDNS